MNSSPIPAARWRERRSLSAGALARQELPRGPGALAARHPHLRFLRLLRELVRAFPEQLLFPPRERMPSRQIAPFPGRRVRDPRGGGVLQTETRPTLPVTATQSSALRYPRKQNLPQPQALRIRALPWALRCCSTPVRATSRQLPRRQNRPAATAGAQRPDLVSPDLSSCGAASARASIYACSGL